MSISRRFTKIWDGPTPGYVTEHAGFQLVVHRTWRTSPAGWVWGVRAGDEESRRDPSGARQYGYGYSSSREQAVMDAIAWLGSERGERELRAATERGPIILEDHSCSFDDGEDYGIEPNWWTLAGGHMLSAATLLELGEAIRAYDEQRQVDVDQAKQADALAGGRR